MASTTETIKDFYNRIIGYIETDNHGNKVAKDFYRRILGYYDKDTNTTKDFYRRVIARGDACVGLIYAENEKQEAAKRQKNNK